MLTMHAGRLNHILICLPPSFIHEHLSTYCIIHRNIYETRSDPSCVLLHHTHRDQLPEIDISENHDFVDSNFKSYEKSINK